MAKGKGGEWFIRMEALVRWNDMKKIRMGVDRDARASMDLVS